MPKFKKTILPVGQFLVTRPDGRRTLKDFSADYLKTVANNAAKMLESGLRIPIPFRHTKSAVPGVKVEELPETDSFDNAGYWESVEFGVDEDGHEALIGVTEDIPGEITDLESPAGKLAKRIKEVSACIVDKWVDGANRAWGPSMLHGAAVINPVVPNQKEWAMLSFPDASMILSVSSVLPQTITGDSIAQLSKALQENVNIFLPPETTPSELVKVLLISVNQHKMSTENTVEDLEIVDTNSIFMSLPQGKKLMPLTTAQAQELVELGLIDPKTKDPIKLENLPIDDTPSNDVGQWQQLATALQGNATEQRKEILRNRVNTLIVNGQANKEYAEKELFPAIDSYSLSLGDGAVFQKTQIDMLIDSLERLPAKQTTPPQNQLEGTGIPSNMSVPAGSHDNKDEMTAEQIKAMKAEMLQDMAV